MRRTALVGVALLLALPPAPVEAQSRPTVSGYVVVASQAKQGHTDVKLRARLTNPLAETLPAATVTVTSRSTSTHVIDGTASFGNVGPGMTVTSLDTLIVRQDGTQAFDPGRLVWAVGVHLGGQPGQPAVDATFDLPPSGVPASEIETLGPGRRVARTIVEVAFLPTATIADVNALLDSVGGRIVSMLEGVAIVVVRIPDPGSIAGLDEVVAQLRGDPLVRRVVPGIFTESDALPANVEAQGAAALDKVRHHLAVRGHAAWNARAALPPLGDRPLLIVADAFGAGVPNAELSTVNVVSDFSTGGPNEHGYHVLGIIAGSFEGAENDRGLVTGMFPGTLQLRAVDRILNGGGGLTAPEKQNAIIQFVKGAPGNVVVNTSQHDCGTLAICGNPTAAGEQAVIWIEKVRGTGGLFGLFGGGNVEHKFVHLTSSGNVNTPGIEDAETNSAWSAARLLAGLEAVGFGESEAVANLTNTLVVDNAMASTTQPFRPTCLAFDSKRTGDLSAIGSNVWSFTGPTTGAGFKWGTSMATPQVAGLAAYVWALNPLLTSQQVTEILLATARQQADLTGSADCDPTTLPAPQIDAYAAVLAADHGSALNGGSPSAAPVRRAILDVASGPGAPGQNGSFDEHDIGLFLAKFDSGGGVVDYSRYDLNGDAMTGGPSTERLDLSIDGAYSTVVREIEGQNVSFAEEALTDIKILCHYSYSPLYTGSLDERANLLSSRCLSSAMSVSVLGQEAGEESSRTVVQAFGNLSYGDAVSELAVEEVAPPVALTATSGPASMVMTVSEPQPNVVTVFTAASASSYPCPSVELCFEYVGMPIGTNARGYVTLRLNLSSPGLLELTIDPSAIASGTSNHNLIAARVLAGGDVLTEVASDTTVLPISAQGGYIVDLLVDADSETGSPTVIAGTVLTIRFHPLPLP